MTTKHTHNDHGTAKSYVIGFILSLIFTFIPYMLVVNQTITGNALLYTIVAFAMIQMLIQVTFFLHIGRGPKPNWNLFFFISTFGIVLFVVIGSIFIMQNLHYNMSPEDKVKKLVNDENIYQVGGQETGSCRELYKNHIITIKDGVANPILISTHKCDTLTFINDDDKTREITFGEHPNHGNYAGETELVIKAGRSKTLSLSEEGTFNFHDHLQPDTAGTFIVMPPKDDATQ